MPATLKTCITRISSFLDIWVKGLMKSGSTVIDLFSLIIKDQSPDHIEVCYLRNILELTEKWVRAVSDP